MFARYTRSLHWQRCRILAVRLLTRSGFLEFGERLLTWTLPFCNLCGTCHTRSAASVVGEARIAHAEPVGLVS